jgi:hypothetical protein
MSVTKLHFLRVGPDGTSTDAVVKQWTQNQTTIFSVGINYPYHITETTVGPSNVEIDAWSVITNADNGALYSWQATEFCYADSEVGPRTRVHLGPCATTPENHLTTSADGAIVTDVIWNQGGFPAVPVRPLLQLEGGAFAGTASSPTGNVLLVFDAGGQLKWTVPTLAPTLAVAEGGLIASGTGGTYQFDADGNATQQFGTLPTISWLGNAYRYGSVLQVKRPAIIPAGQSFAIQPGGNPSGTGIRAFTDPQLAAFAALNFLWPFSVDWEWGGFVCDSTLVSANGDVTRTYLWSRLVTSRLQHKVDFPSDLTCAPHGAEVSRFHTHPHIDGAPYPSGFQPGTT